jgi:Leucine-rich repeat (LRR) protein
VARENHYKAHNLSQEIFGLESYVERVEMLLTSAGSDASPRYFGVWGMGGVGKTFLLRKVWESLKVQAHFQGATFIWLTVGQTPDMLLLYRSISDDMGSKLHLHSNMVDYKQKLESELTQKRVFLVLDDVWKDEDFDALDLGKGEGSVTLLSTRIESILQRPCISQEHMKTLSPEHSWSLFRVHAFGTSSSVPHRLEASAKSMAEECGGLPLALKVIGAAMFGKTSDEREWKPLLKKLKESRMQERTMKSELYEHLKLGYDVLKEADPRLQDCFTYFAAFPGDHEVEFQVLLWCWIGEGLVPGDVEDDPEIDAYDLLMKLRRRSLIESIEKFDIGELGMGMTAMRFNRWMANEMRRAAMCLHWWVTNERDKSQHEEILGEDVDEESDELDEESHEELDGESDVEVDEESDEELDEKFFPSDKLRDMWRNILGRHVNEESDGELDEESDEEVDKESDEELDEKFDEEVFPGYKLHDVMRDLAFYILQIDGGTTPAKQLALYQAGQNLTEFPPKWITECKQPLKARRLSLRENKLKTLPSTFCAPELLTLLLGDNQISDVPAGFLKGIQNLRVLDLCAGGFRYLPEELGNLKHLVYLNLSCNPYLRELPESIENLRMLRNLNLLRCYKLRHLPSGMVGLESLQVLDTTSCVRLSWAEHTHREMGPRHIVMAESSSHEAKAKGVSLENISRLRVLTHLRIEGQNCQHVLLPGNISALTELEELRLYSFHNLKTLPAWMPDFKKLRSLSVTECDHLERLPGSFTHRGAFPALIEFKLEGCINLVEFPEVEGDAMPKLQTLNLSRCKSLGSLPLSLEVLTNLRNLDLQWCTTDLKRSCRKNRENSLIWRSFRIKFSEYQRFEIDGF